MSTITTRDPGDGVRPPANAFDERARRDLWTSNGVKRTFEALAAKPKGS